MASLTKQQAEALLRAYIREQTEATDKEIAAYGRETAAQLQETEREAEAGRREAIATEREQYSKAAVQAMIDRYAVAQTLASLGLSRSGAADSAREATAVRKTVAEQQATAKTRQTLSALSQRLLTAREQATAKRESHAAAARKTLGGKIAEKRLTLNRATMQGG